MKKRFLLVASLIMVIVISIILYLFYNPYAEFEKIDYSKWNDTAKSHITGKTEIDLLRNITHLIGSEGEFRGTIKQYKPSFDSNQLIIEIHDAYVPDDSIGSIDHRFKAEKRDAGYVITEYFRKTENK